LARYSVDRRRPENRGRVCHTCRIELLRRKSSANKFCSVTCANISKRAETLGKYIFGEYLTPKIVRNCTFEVKGEECTNCGQGSTWHGKPLSLHVDHIDGDSDNNAMVNLRVLCPNCHTQTETYGSKGIGNRYKKMRKRNLAVRKSKGYVE
jgi:endogenous inhibitor of DNA gyrase (YacG/DUF329 family)